MRGFLGCTADDLTRSMTIEVFSVEDPTRATTASICDTWICGEQPLQSFTNETPLPIKSALGGDTCPLPPD